MQKTNDGSGYKQIKTQKNLKTNETKMVRGGISFNFNTAYGADGPAALKADQLLVKTDPVLRTK